MKDKDRRYRSSVEFTIEIQADGVWGGDFTLAKVEQMAAREAEDDLRNALSHIKAPYRAPIIHKLQVLAVTVYREKK